ncbi:6-phosphogluconolactonase [Polycyclovorans algicola]|uniref:6-phosphogluconolactonase n=1 Tax=Polycyclovorans algicola TaxID=616992 RepID=UPI0004A6FC21|nr:6-phosphogluconolactonase [Polycyclovorans algicola]
MNKPIWHRHTQPAAMVAAASAAITTLIGDALTARGHALLALPGGRTPEPIFERLAAANLDWSRVTLLPTDDRLVDVNDPLSNAALLKRHFAARGARIVPLVADPNMSPLRAGDDADARLQSLPWPLDLAWLGVGSDGHTASIFPGPDLDAALTAPLPRRAVGVRPEPLPPEAPVARVSLTMNTLCTARHLLLTLTGHDKLKVIEQALDAEPSPQPVGHLLQHAKNPTTIYWSAS